MDPDESSSQAGYQCRGEIDEPTQSEDSASCPLASKYNNSKPVPEEEDQSQTVVQEGNATPVSKCIICKKSTEEDSKIKTYSDTTGPSLKSAAGFRTTLRSDKYEEVTKRIVSSDVQGKLYHPSCHRLYTAVKRPKDGTGSEPQPKKARRETRTNSTLPETGNRGILKRPCIFCGKNRKKKRGKEERLMSVATDGGCDTLVERAPQSRNERFKSLILGDVNLVAKEGKYHKSCRVEFMHETEIARHSKATPREFNKRAFSSLCGLINMEVVQNKKALLVSSLLHTYKLEYTSNGGKPEDISSYSSQNLIRKIQDKFAEKIRVQLADQRRGNYICASSLTDEEARSQIFHDAQEHEENEKLRWAALHLRSLIMQLPKSKTPVPATVQNLKESSPDIPKQLDIFFRSLLGGVTPAFQGAQTTAIDRKVALMASDAVFNVSWGTVKPWKHIAMGLGMSSLTGSKLVLQILNRAGHSISYSDAKGLETEFAYSVTSDGRDAPDGIHLLPDRSTACVWDNNDANVETLDGKATLHSTVGHTYQNIMEHDNEEGAHMV
ncbi:uncharacterized protein LOC125724829 [Brienomyrus brachyistius]|uniref:uncharacterized protein LOC125724829 n=1 Tax=Brienomyrus brachyistius TaxID=42636 RepID=UPI0020B1E51E|nr:uncharacterized protein LOC125724829 [Brienomyrus brachyistius]XP_048857265.1 uncharacterized protein LOC125724829 [Brienomyrus brachyistius]